MHDRLLLACLLIGTSAAFVGNSVKGRPSMLSLPTPPMMSSYEVDSDEDAEQRLGEGINAQTIQESIVMEDSVNGDSDDRYEGVLRSVGLDGKLNHANSLPKERTVSSYDVFCNRELKQEAITAIGFDMVRAGCSVLDVFCLCSSHVPFRITLLYNTNSRHLTNWHSTVPKRSL